MTLAGCILIAIVGSGHKIVDTGEIRLEAKGAGFTVYRCSKDVIKVKRAYTVDASRPLRRMVYL